MRKFPVIIVGGGPVGFFFSKSLSVYGIKHCLIERKLEATTHPQAHFINARSMEILRSEFPVLFNELIPLVPPFNNWSDFVYTHSILEKPFSRVNHFQQANTLFWESTLSNIAHLSQNKFENLLRKFTVEQTNKYAEYFLGYECQSISSTTNNVSVNLISNQSLEKVTLHGNYLIAADGANSMVRKQMQIELKGQDAIQHIMNVHFMLPGLSRRLHPNPAMLYFVFNEVMVSVFVFHDPSKDEWVCQIPYFPPYQQPSDYDQQIVKEIIMKSIGKMPDSSIDPSSLRILSIKHWTMHAEVAESFQNNFGNIYLLGDAAHRFPPAGGFGMNTGIQDAHNIAWKLAAVLSNGANKSLLTNTYERERKPIAEQNTQLSIRNYQKGTACAAALGVDPDVAKFAVNTLSSDPLRVFIPNTLLKQATLFGLNVGLSTLKYLQDWENNWIGRLRVRGLQRIIDEGKSLPLIFPDEDIAFVYEDGAILKDSDSSLGSKPMKTPSDGNLKGNGSSLDDWKLLKYNKLRVGQRIPHIWFQVNGQQLVDHSSAVGMVSSLELVSSIHALKSLKRLYLKKGMAEDAVPSISAQCVIMIEKGSKSTTASMNWIQSILKIQGGKSLFTVVMIEDAKESVTNALSEHIEVQMELQVPRYLSHKSPEPMKFAMKKVISFNGILHEKLSQNFKDGSFDVFNLEDVFTAHEDDKANTVNVMSVIDFSCLWKAASQNYLQGFPNLSVRDKIALILRPDGHVAAIHKYRDDIPTTEEQLLRQEKDFTSFLKAALLRLHFTAD